MKIFYKISFWLLLCFFSIQSNLFGKLLWTPETGWIDANKLVAKEPKKIYRNAQELMKNKEPMKAAEELEKLVKTDPRSELSKKALLIIAKIYKKNKWYYKSYLKLEDYLRWFPKEENYREIIKMEIDLADFLLKGAKVEFMGTGLRISSGRSKGLEILKNIKLRFPHEEFSDDIQFKIAGYYFEEEDFDRAIIEYETLKRNYPDSEWIKSAEYKISQCYTRRHRGAEYDSTYLKEGVKRIDKYIERDKEKEGFYLKKALEQRRKGREKLAEKEYKIAQFYLHSGKKKSAIIYLKTLIQKYSETSWANKSKKLLKEIENEK